MIQHGAPFTLLAQAGPSFTRTKGGGFDVGTRRFKCHVEDVDALLATHFAPGRADASIVAAASGATQPGKTTMLVSGAAFDRMEGGRAIIRADYEGVMFPKKGTAVYSTRTAEQSGMVLKPGYTILRPTHLLVPVPTATHTWTTIGGRPSILAPGAAVKPPGISSIETALASQYFEDVLDGMVIVSQGWRLANRSIRSPGDMISSVVWEVIDTYEWVTIRVSATATP